VNGNSLKRNDNIDLRKVVITGAAGFIGSNLVDSFLASGSQVIGIDNLSTGRIEFLREASRHKNFFFHHEDLLQKREFADIFKGADAVFHFAANADVRYGPDHPSRDLEQNTIVTHRMLEAARIANIKKFVFSSTGSVYGESQVVPTPEDAPFPVQTSLYGASKLACEGLISAYAESFGIQAWIFRFVSILGPRYTHGHVFDFIKQLNLDPGHLTVLGNGHQNKSYLHVSDCVSGIFQALKCSHDQINIFNLGVDGVCEVKDSIKWIIDELKLSPSIFYGSEIRGWIGDNPLIYLDTKKIRELGWIPKFTIEESVRDTVRFITSNRHLLVGTMSSKNT
jgi:UDP-glucose 4-epimerase